MAERARPKERVRKDAGRKVCLQNVSPMATKEPVKPSNAEVSEGGTRDSRIETAAQSRPSLN